MIVVIGLGLLILLFMTAGHPEVWEQSRSARIFAVGFLYWWLLLVGYLLGRRRRRASPYYMAQCGHCGASELIPRDVRPEDREQWAIKWAREHNQLKHGGEA